MRRLIAAAIVIGAVAFSLALASATPVTGAAQALAGSGVNFWIAVPNAPDCSTEQGDATCHVPMGQTFLVDTYVDSAGVTYGGYDVALRYEGVVPNHDANSYAWPDCGLPAASYDTPGLVEFGCSVGINAPGSSYDGVVGTNSFVCSQSGSISLVHGIGSTDLVDFDNLVVAYSEDPNTSETLNISCDLTGTPITTTPTPTPIPTFPPPLPPPAFDVNFWIAVEGSPGCTTEHGDATCDFAPGTTFTIDAHLGPLPSSLQSYVAFNLYMTYSGVIPASDQGGPTGGCVYGQPPDFDVFECGGRPLGGLSAAPGILHSVRFECVQSGSIVLLHGINETEVFDASRGEHAEGRNTSETLTINCGDPDPPAVSLPNTGSTSGRQDNVWRLTVIASCAGAALFAVGAWSSRRRRL